MSQDTKDFEVYEHHAADLGSFQITPNQGSLAGSKAYFRAGWLDNTAIDLDSDLSTEILWVVSGTDGLAQIDLTAATVAALRTGSNDWQLTVETVDGVQLLAVKGKITKRKALEASP